MKTTRCTFLMAAALLPALLPAQQSTSGSGVSSSTHHPRLRHRKAAPDAPADTTPVEAPVEPVAEAAESTSADKDETAPQTITMTAADETASAKISDAARTAVLITARDLDLHLNADTATAEARAQVTVTNTGKEALTVVPLRVSGALKWESARLLDTNSALPLEQHHMRDDLDHSGVATELALTLPLPLAPGASVKLDLFYGGSFAANQSRLLALHAPNAVAIRTDWDTVTPAFTGLRGLGNVEWYPVTGRTASLSNSEAVPLAVEASRSREAESSMHLRLTLQHDGPAPDAAFLLGQRQTFAAAAEGFSTAEWTMPHIGPHTPSLFITSAAPQTMAGGTVRVVTESADHAASVGEAVARLKPMMEQWLGPKPARPLDVIDLPIPDAAGFSDGALLVAPLRTAEPGAFSPSLIVPLTNAWLPDTITAPWLRDGIPAFLQALWAERSSGRAAAMAGLSAQDNAMKAVDAPASSSSSDSPAPNMDVTPLVDCSDAACARIRTAYALEMLRTTLGDSGLQAVLSGWTAAQDNKPTNAAEETATFERLARQVAAPKNLDWYFKGWIYGHGTLPQLTIVAVAPRKIERAQAPADLLPKRQTPVAGPIGAEPVAPPDDPRNTWGGDKGLPPAGSWLVAVEVQNAGGTDAEVPVTVRAGTLSNTLPLHVPAHGKATIRIPFEAEPEDVEVNDGTIPEAGPTVHHRSIR